MSVLPDEERAVNVRSNRKDGVIRLKCLLNKLESPEEPYMHWLFSGQNFDKEQKVSRRNGKGFLPAPLSFPLYDRLNVTVWMERLCTAGHALRAAG